jgi:hypothetical protein
MKIYMLSWMHLMYDSLNIYPSEKHLKVKVPEMMHSDSLFIL